MIIAGSLNTRERVEMTLEGIHRWRKWRWRAFPMSGGASG